LLENIHICIVDDSECVREAIKVFIQSLGYAATTFASAHDYLRSGLTRHTSCLISDVDMPEMDGPALQERLIADGHAIPIIFVTATSDEAIRNRVLKAGALGILSKPFHAPSLIAHLNKAIK
jgi:FixJ family two-component response regulator